MKLDQGHSGGGGLGGEWVKFFKRGLSMKIRKGAQIKKWVI